MNTHRLFLGLAVAGLTFRAPAQTNRAPFSWDWSRAHESVPDLSRFLDAPAGKGGFLRVRDGHFLKPDGSRLRLWGVNITSRSSFPPKDLAPRIADDLARLGFNDRNRSQARTDREQLLRSAFAKNRGHASPAAATRQESGCCYHFSKITLISKS